MNKKLDYGLDAPGLVKAFFAGGLGLIAVGIVPYIANLSEIWRSIFSSFWSAGLCFLISSFLMIWSSRSGKLHARDRLFLALNLQGDETILDLGCGRGLLLVGGAKLVPKGKVIGIDLWSQQDLADNGREAALANAELEGVAGRVEILNGDMRQLPLKSNSVDVVVASMSIHNIPTIEGRREAIQEAVRVLKPGGHVALLDFRSTAEYESALREFGMKGVRRSHISFWNFPPSRTVFGQK